MAESAKIEVVEEFELALYVTLLTGESLVKDYDGSVVSLNPPYFVLRLHNVLFLPEPFKLSVERIWFLNKTQCS